MKKGGAAYILTNKTHTVLYTGVTSDLKLRLHQHKTKENPKSFTAKYKVYKLVYFKSFHNINDAITKEKRIKDGNREKKIELIESINPNWNELQFELDIL